jgi:hypothetical protein
MDLPDGAVLLVLAGRLAEQAAARALDPATAAVTPVGEAPR